MYSITIQAPWPSFVKVQICMLGSTTVGTNSLVLHENVSITFNSAICKWSGTGTVVFSGNGYFVKPQPVRTTLSPLFGLDVLSLIGCTWSFIEIGVFSFTKAMSLLIVCSIYF